MTIPTPQLPHYRITLFYGPEPVAGRQAVQDCVFNVKKRSWKAGVQVAVELADSQMTRARAMLGFGEWLRDILARLDPEDRTMYERRAEELLIQNMAAVKLDLAIDAGMMAQENQRLDSEALVLELDRRLPEHDEQIKARILAELDL